jgi:hypothetical protein
VVEVLAIQKMIFVVLVPHLQHLKVMELVVVLKEFFLLLKEMINLLLIEKQPQIGENLLV